MQKMLILFLLISGGFSAPQAQRRGAPTSGNVTFAVSVADPSGAPIPGVKVTVTGAAERTGRTEAGRLAFENLPAGTYRFRFDREGFISFEKELVARGAAPIEVKVTLAPAPPPPAPPAPAAPPPMPPDAQRPAKPVVLDMPAFIEKNYIGRASGK